jgi:acetylornithine deacetylase/succinyl-diaminopimelate desuccinylase-like protein
MDMDIARAESLIEQSWQDSIVPQLIDYIRIPNKSPMFDPDWQAHGYMDAAVDLIETWCHAQPLRGLSVEVVRLPGRTPLIYMEIPGDADATVLLYGHLDKQPEMTGWREGLGPWEPVIEGERLYGRGGADDGYAAFASLTAIQVLQDQGIAHARCVVIIEACEESGSYDLPFYIEALSQRIGNPDLVICLDSGAGNYDQLWCTTSLRGLVGGTLSIDVLAEGVHSGDAGGIVPSTFRVARQLLARLEDQDTGTILPSELHVEIPPQRIAQAQVASEVLADQVYAKFPFLDGVNPVAGEFSELILNRTWRPALELTGAGGLPSLADAGNVLRPRTSLKLSLRIPPTLDAQQASDFLEKTLEGQSPYGARVNFEPDTAGAGWNAPPMPERLVDSIDAASQAFFGARAVHMGEGGTIPFMGMLGELFPRAQFLITGVLGPQSNAHGPNEFLHIPTGKKLTGCVAKVLADHAGWDTA